MLALAATRPVEKAHEAGADGDASLRCADLGEDAAQARDRHSRGARASTA